MASSRRQLKLTAAASTVATLLLVGQPVRAESGEYSIRDITAHLYYQGTGTIGTSNILDPRTALWNTIGGEGDAEKPSAITLVLVTVTGSFLAGRPAGSIKLKSEAPGAAPALQSIPFGVMFSESGQVVAPFLVHGTGCGDLKLTAHLVGVEATPDRMDKIIPFRCGE